MSAMLSARDLADLRAVKVAALQNIGVGGSSWTVTRAAGGDGITSGVTTGTVTITGYIHQEKEEHGAYALAGTSIPISPWRLVLLAGTVHAGDILVSAADASVRFQVEQPVDRALYSEAIARPV